MTGHATERFVVPLPAYAEVLVGEGNQPGPADISGAQNALAWTELYDVTDRHAALGAEAADELEPEGPYLGGCDAPIAAVGRELDAPVASADGDLTHEETKTVVDVDEYRARTTRCCPDRRSRRASAGRVKCATMATVSSRPGRSPRARSRLTSVRAASELQALLRGPQTEMPTPRPALSIVPGQIRRFDRC